MIDWAIVAQALEASKYNRRLAEMILATAGTIEPITDGQEPVMHAVVYGETYTDILDPRDEDCRVHRVVDGKPVGILLRVHTAPSSQFRCTRVELVQRDESCNTYFSMTDSLGRSLNPFGCALFSPYNGNADGFPDIWQAPASPASIFMGGGSKFASPGLGPMAAAIVDDRKRIISDVVGGIGLLHGQHWSFRVYFQER